MGLIYKVKAVEAIYDAIKRYLIGIGSQITNFNPGSRARTIAESVSTVIHQTQYDFNKALKTAIPLAAFNGFEFTKLSGAEAVGKLEFTRSTPAGSDIAIATGTGILLDGLTYETIEDGEISTGNTSSGQISAICTTEGTSGNINTNAINTTAGQGSFINQPVGVEACTNPVAFAGGKDEESDEERLTRFREYVNALARSTPQGIIAGVKTVDGVVSVTLVENDPTVGVITLYVDDGTGTLTPALKAEVEKVINGDPNDIINYPGYRAAGISVIVEAPTVSSIDITAEIRILNSSLADDSELENLAQSAIERYVNTLGLGYDVIVSEIVTAAQNSHDDIYDVIVTLPAGNFTVTSGQVARTGTVNVSSTRVGV